MKPRKAGAKPPAPEGNPTDRASGSAPPMPSVWELGLLAERFRLMARDIDATPAAERSVACPYRPELDKEAALFAARDREHATIDLLLTLPAKTLRDAAVQLHHVGFLFDQMDHEDAGQRASALRTLQTTFASIGAAVLDHAKLDYIGSGIDFTEMLDQWTNIHLEVTKPPA